jgi:GT2 family glycosyltransferase
MDVSVIVVNWNTRAMTLECLASLYRETQETSFETILVDNGSADGSAAAIAEGFPQVQLIAETTNHGFAMANNIAAERAQGEYILLLNSDTVVLDQAVDRLIAFARRRPDARLWGGRTVFADGSLNIGSAWGAQTLWSAFCFGTGLTLLFPRSSLFNPEGMTGWRRDTERSVDIVSGCFLLIETKLWHRLGGFDPAFFMYGEEADLCRRARDIGVRPAVTPEATIIHHGGASGSLRANSSISICKAKIALAQRSMSPAAAAATRWLIAAGVVLRRLCYGLAAKVRADAAPKAQLWRDVWARRAEWLAAPVVSGAAAIDTVGVPRRAAEGRANTGAGRPSADLE